jgi:hypothetical protein
MTFSFKSIASWTLLLLLILQFIPLNRINVPADSTITAPDPIKKVLKRSCYDCHSNETRWTGFAYIAPASWWISGIVASGRKALNFSTASNKNRAKIRKVISGKQAHYQLYYLWKPDAQLTLTETNLLMKWLN